MIKTLLFNYMKSLFLSLAWRHIIGMAMQGILDVYCTNACASRFFNMNHRITTGFFVENTVVLAEGEMLLDGIFQVCVNFVL